MSDFLNELFADWTGVIRIFAGLAAITLIVVVAIASKLAWGKIIMSTIVAAFVLWAVSGNGLGWFSDKIGEETNASGQSIHQVDDTFVLYESADMFVLVS